MGSCVLARAGVYRIEVFYRNSIFCKDIYAMNQGHFFSILKFDPFLAEIIFKFNIEIRKAECRNTRIHVPTTIKISTG